MKKTSTVGIRVDAFASAEELATAAFAAREQKRPWLVTFANPATAVAAKSRPDLVEALRRFDAVAPDGTGMVIAMRRSHRGLDAARISFDSTSLAPIVFQGAAARGVSVVLSGGAAGVAQGARNRLTAAYPGLRVIGVFDGFNPEASVAAIVALDPGIVVAGMGALVQEKFLLRLVQAGWRGLGFTCGGYLDQLSLKGESYYPAWVDRSNLRFAYRFVMEPKRLWRRYLMEYPQFCWYLGAALVNGRKGQ